LTAGPSWLDNHQVTTTELAFLLVHEEPIFGSVPVSQDPQPNLICNQRWLTKQLRRGRYLRPTPN
jgi:hypothetical protein